MNPNKTKVILAAVAGLLFVISYLGLPTVGVAGVVLAVAVALP